MAINLLPWREAIYIKKQREFSFLLLGGCLLAGMGLWRIHGMISQEKIAIQKHQASLSEQVHIFQEKNKEQAGVWQEEDRKKTPWRHLVELSKKEKCIPSFLKALNGVNFKGIYLTHLSFEKNQWHLKGVAPYVLSVFQLMSELKACPVVGAVQFSGAEAIQNSGFEGAPGPIRKYPTQMTFHLQVECRASHHASIAL